MKSAELYQSWDAAVWAKEFCRICIEKGFDPAKLDDVDWVRGWIANAMMRGYDQATGFAEIAPAMLADGIVPPCNCQRPKP